MKNLRETIHEITSDHLISDGVLLGQCLCAVGFCNGTVPNMPDKLIELPTSDLNNCGVAVGFALAGKRPIQVVRYGGFTNYLISLFNYANISKVMWNTPCPVFLRCMGSEGNLGPVATGSHHSAAMRFPGIRVVAPMCPSEWAMVWMDFLAGDDPVYCSEHRLSYDWTERENWRTTSDVTILGIAGGRLNGLQAAREADCSYVSIFELKPLGISEEAMRVIRKSRHVIVVDSDYTDCGASEHICYQLSQMYPNVRFHALGVTNRTAGFSPLLDNKTPSVEEIVKFVEYFK